MPNSFVVHKSAIFAETSYGAVILDDRTGDYWQLNPTSALIFTALRDGEDLGAIAERVVEMFGEVDLDTAVEDLTVFVNELRAAGIVE